MPCKRGKHGQRIKFNDNTIKCKKTRKYLFKNTRLYSVISCYLRIEKNKA